MAIYRQIHTTYWKDDFIGECNQLQKLFYLYVFTNDKTTQSGAYKFSYRYACFELGIDDQKVDELIEYFVKGNKIKFNKENSEILVLNWLKYNKATSPKVAPVIDRELKDIKTVEFKLEVVKNCIEYKYPIKTTLEEINKLSIPYQYPMDSQSQPEPEPEPTYNQNQQQQETEKTPVAANAFDFYQNNFGVMAPTVMETVAHWIDDISEELVIEALRRAVIDQKGFRYAEGIMKNWDKKNLKTMEDVLADDVSFNNRSNKFSRQPTRKETLPDWVNDPVKETPVSEDEITDFKRKLEELRRERPNEADE